MQNGASAGSTEQEFDAALGRGDLGGAKAALTALEQDHQDDLFTGVARARMRAAEGDVDGAITALQALVNQRPRAGLPRAYLGSLLVALGQTTKGMTHLKTALSSEGGDVPSAHHAVGLAMLRAGKLAEAAQHLEQAAAGMPDAAAPAFHLGEALEALGRSADAEPRYTRCVEIEPSFAAAWAGLVRLRALSGRLEEAETTVTAALAANPGDLGLMRFRVQVALDRGDMAAARRALEDIPAAERSVEDLANLALFALGEDDFTSALAHAEAAAHKDSGHWRPAYLVGLAKEGQGAPLADVIAAYEGAITKGDPAGEAATRLGYVLLAADAAERAIDVLADAAQKNGRAPGTLLNLALAYAKAGRAENARTLAEEVTKSPQAREADKAEAAKLAEALKG